MESLTIAVKQDATSKAYFQGEEKIRTYKETLVGFLDVQMEKLQDCIDIALENENVTREVFLMETVFEKVKADILQCARDIEEHHGLITLIKACHRRIQGAGVYVENNKTLGTEFTPAEVEQ